MLSDVAYQRDYADAPKSDIATLAQVMSMCVKAQAELANLLGDDEQAAQDSRTPADDAADDPRHGQAALINAGKV